MLTEPQYGLSRAHSNRVEKSSFMIKNQTELCLVRWAIFDMPAPQGSDLKFKPFYTENNANLFMQKMPNLTHYQLLIKSSLTSKTFNIDCLEKPSLNILFSKYESFILSRTVSKAVYLYLVEIYLYR